jgi:hypothetical protein
MNASVDRALIPNHFHFIWFGSTLPDFGHIAIRSALTTNPGSTATLWCGDGFESSPETHLLAHKGLRIEKIDVGSLLHEVYLRDSGIKVLQLWNILRELRRPEARANVVRMLVLYLYGGVYLDTDTLSLKPLSGLRRSAAFCGKETILWPAGSSPLDPRILALSEMRGLCATMRHGYRWNKRLLRFYSLAANNAVIGARAGHPLLTDMLKRAAAMDPAEWKKRFRLGTHLLQQALPAFESEVDEPDSVRVLAPEYFYPVGPKVSRHYFHNYDEPSLVAAELIGDATHVIHWYASVSDLKSRGYAHIRASSQKNVYSHLCRQYAGLEPAPRNAPAQVLAPSFG